MLLAAILAVAQQQRVSNLYATRPAATMERAKPEAWSSRALEGQQSLGHESVSVRRTRTESRTVHITYINTIQTIQAARLLASLSCWLDEPHTRPPATGTVRITTRGSLRRDRSDLAVAGLALNRLS